MQFICIYSLYVHIEYRFFSWTHSCFFFSYTNDSPELFQRKLGDLAFLVQNYEFAYNSYHTAKRDFNHEHAWFYFAGALVSEGFGGDHYYAHEAASLF